MICLNHARGYYFTCDSISRAVKIISVVTGTSTDGLSISLVDVDGCDESTKVKVLDHSEVPFPSSLREDLLRISTMQNINSESYSAAHWGLGRFIGEQLEKLSWDCDFVAFSGYTVYHGPSLGAREKGTLQIGEVSEIYARTGKTVLYDFRTTDLSMGGDGAPLIALSDKLLFREHGTVTVNIGGISNVTYIGDHILAFDTGPGNLLIDLYARKYNGAEYDRDGKIASTGKVNEELLERLLDDDYFRKDVPKTTGREYFTESYVEKRLSGLKVSGEDVVRTLTRFTAQAIKEQTGTFLPGEIKRVVVGGGGCLNPVLMSDMEDLFGMEIGRFSDIGIDDKAREGVGFAIIANQTIHGRIGNTEASGGKPSVLGKILPGESFRSLIK